jgi:hypothetical protein
MDKRSAGIPGDSETLILPSTFRLRLIQILQLAYSGERAAAYAYRGHWRSVASSEERERIHRIEDEEWHHRRLVGQTLCHVSGWLLPMYGAGKLERRNIVEYENAARYAVGCGKVEFVDCLLMMAEVEWEHEQYFRAKVLSHPVGRLLPIWPAPPPKETIRRILDQVPSMLTIRNIQPTLRP